MARTKQTPAEISDFGEKIGGARKDTAKSPTRVKGKIVDTDTRPGWMKRFVAAERLAGNQPTGEWVLLDTRRQSRYGGNAQASRMTFPSQAAAEQAIPALAVAQKHYVRTAGYKDGKETGFEIWRKVTDKKTVKAVPQVFPSREDAMLHMAQNAATLMGSAKGYGEELLKTPDHVKRVGPAWREGDARPEQFMTEFRARGVEFGNWQDDRGRILNHAYDALHDLADVTGVKPDSLTLGNKLGIAFGARGSGGKGAGRAHYEAQRAAINLTKEGGAGSLAHEWWHAADHYLAQIDDPSLGQFETKPDGTRVLNTKGLDDMLFMSSRARSQRLAGSLDATVRSAYADLMSAITEKPSEVTVEAERFERRLAAEQTTLKTTLDRVRRDLEQRAPYGKRFVAPASAEQLARFDAAAEKILSGQHSETKFVPNDNKGYSGRGLPSFSGRRTNDALEAISSVYKEVRGRTGFDSQHQRGAMDEIRRAMEGVKVSREQLTSAKTSPTRMVMTRTDFLNEAARLDGARTVPYWSTKPELTARAFSAYVEDKLKAAGRQSDYLSFGSENWLYALEESKPFPEGAERARINAAFDNLFDAMKKAGVVEPAPVTAGRLGTATTIEGAMKEAGGSRPVMDTLTPRAPEFDTTRRASGTALGSDHQVAVVDVAKLEEALKASNPLHVGPNAEGGSTSKYAQIAAADKPVPLPVLGVLENGQPGFEDGRHRFAVARDAGATTIPVAMDPDSVANAEKHGLLAKQNPGWSDEARAASAETRAAAADQNPINSSASATPEVPIKPGAESYGENKVRAEARASMLNKDGSGWKVERTSAGWTVQHDGSPRTGGTEVSTSHHEPPHEIKMRQAGRYYVYEFGKPIKDSKGGDKWFGSQEKAKAYLEKRNATANRISGGDSRPARITTHTLPDGPENAPAAAPAKATKKPAREAVIGDNGGPSEQAIKTAQRLEEVAKRTIAKAEATIAQPRQMNTARRARMGSGVIDQAQQDIADAKTALKIAEALRNGEAGALANVKSLADIRELRRLAKQAEWATDAKEGRGYKPGGHGVTQADVSNLGGAKGYVRLSMSDVADMKAALAGKKGVASDLRTLETYAQNANAGRTSYETSDPRVLNAARNIATVIKKADNLKVERPHQADSLKWRANTILSEVRDFDRAARLAGGASAEGRQAALQAFLDVREGKAKPNPIAVAEQSLIGMKLPGFFPTPADLAKRMAEMADIQPGMTVLEPSAGTGRLADAVKAVQPKASLSVVEMQSTLRDILAKKGYEVAATDFTSMESAPAYDRIVMNPPFERGQDIEHVKRAYEMLKPGGKIVAIMGEGAFFRQDKSAAEFRQWLGQVGTSEQLPENTFRESNTGVNTRLVTIQKPAAANVPAVVEPAGLTASIGGKRYPVTSWEQLSSAYSAMRDAVGEGASRTPNAKVYDAKGNVVATVSYNGKVWAGATPGSAGATPLFDPYAKTAGALPEGARPGYIPGVGNPQEPYWTYKAPPTPTVADLPPGAFSGTQREFESLSPGMRREIKRSAEKMAAQQNAGGEQPGWSDAAREASAKVRAADAAAGHNAPPQPTDTFRSRVWQHVTGGASKPDAAVSTSEFMNWNATRLKEYLAHRGTPVRNVHADTYAPIDPHAMDAWLAQKYGITDPNTLPDVKRYGDRAQSAPKPAQPAAATVQSAVERAMAAQAAKPQQPSTLVAPPAPAAEPVATPKSTIGSKIIKGNDKLGLIAMIAAPAAAAAVAYDATKSQAQAAGKNDQQSAAAALKAAGIAGGTTAAIGYGIMKGINLGLQGLSKAAPVAGKVAARALPGVGLALTAYGAYHGFQKGGLTGAALGTIGAEGLLDVGKHQPAGAAVKGSQPTPPPAVPPAPLRNYDAANAAYTAMRDANAAGTTGEVQEFTRIRRIPNSSKTVTEVVKAHHRRIA